MAEELKGATIVKKEEVNEAGAKLNAIKKQSSFDEYLEAQRRAEQESMKPLSSDLEVVEKVSDDLLRQLQKDNRLVGWSPKTKTALVLKLAFLDKIKKVKKGE